MKKLLSLVVVLVIAFTAMSFSRSYKWLWKKYEVAFEQGLPQTMKECLSQITDKAQKDKEIGHYFKANILKSNIATLLGEVSIEDHIKNIENWLASTTVKEDQAILSAVLFQEYLSFYNRNRYKITTRTVVSDKDSVLNDINLWTDNQFRDKLEYLYYRIFKDSSLLVNKSVKGYVPYIEINPFGKYFNHDLYHVLFWYIYPLLDNVPVSQGEVKLQSGTLLHQALDVYKSNPNAFFLIKLEEIKNHTMKAGYGDDAIRERDEKLALLIKENQDLEVVVEGVYTQMLYTLEKKDRENYYTDMLALCDQYKSKFSSYSRIEILDKIINKIKKPELSVSLFNKWSTSNKFIPSIEYRNIHFLNINAYRVTDLSILPDDDLLTESFISEKTSLVQSLKWEDLYTSDYKIHKKDSVEFSLDEQGFYILKTETDNSETPLYQWVHVSDVEVIISTPYINNSNINFYVVDGVSGKPVADVLIHIYNESTGEAYGSIISDGKGRASWKVNTDAYNVSVIAKKEDRILYHNSSLYLPKTEEEKELKSTKLVSDREIYRPGQTIYIKGYVYQFKDDCYEVVKDYSDELSVSDASGTELFTHKVTTNEFGTFSDSIKLPEKMVTGNVYVSLKNNSSTLNLTVEEYKRPTFTVNFNPIKSKYISGDTIEIKGNVESFSGSFLKDAKVTVEVSTYDYFYQTLRIPCFFILNNQENVLSADEFVLDESGDFILKIPTLKEEKDYTISLKVTSRGGETQDATKKISVMATPYFLHSKLSGVQNKDSLIDISVVALNLDHQEVEADLKYTIKKIMKSSKDGESDVYEEMKTGVFNSSKKHSVDLSNLPVGEYIITYHGDDLKYNLQRQFILFTEKTNEIPILKGSWLYVKKSVITKDSPAEVFYGAAEKDAYVFIDIYNKDGQLFSADKKMSNSYERFAFEDRPEYRDGIIVLFTYVKNHVCYTDQVQLFRKSKSTELKLKWSSFRDRIEPGSQEEWTLEVLDNKNHVVEAEIMASMYDASLDELTPYSRNSFNFYRNSNIPYVSMVYWRLNKYEYSPLFRTEKWKEIPRIIYDEIFKESSLAGEYSTRGSNGRINASYRKTSSDNKRMDDIVTTAFGSMQKESQEELPVMDLVLEDKGIEPIRSNFNELAFFKPHLKVDKKGRTLIKFTVPEQLSKWRFRALAHTKNLNIGDLESFVYTEKNFSISPNIPRFIRQNDEVILISTLKNDAEKKQNTVVELTLFDPYTENIIYRVRQNALVAEKTEKTLQFKLPLIKDIDALGVKITAKSSEYSDGEQHVIPVLPDVEPLMESKPVILVEEGKYTFDLSSLYNKQSNTAKDKKLTIEFMSDPSWFIIRPMLRLWNSSIDSSMGCGNQLVASSIAYSLLAKNTRFFDTIDSESLGYKLLDKNKEVKTLLIEETPWYQFSQNEKELLAQLKVQTIENTSPIVISSLIEKLSLFQDSDGGFSWYEGMESSSYVTLSIMKTLLYLDQGSMLHSLNMEKKVRSMLDRGYDYLFEDLLYKKSNFLLGNKTYAMEIISLRLKDSGLSLDKEELKYYEKILPDLSSILQDGSLYDKSLALEVLMLTKKQKEADKFAKSIKEHLLIGRKDGAYFSGSSFENRHVSTQVETHLKAMKALYDWDQNEELLNQMKFWLASKLNSQKLFNVFLLNDALHVIAELGNDAKNEKQTSLEIKVGNDIIKLDSSMPYLKRTFILDKKSLNSIEVAKNGTAPIWGGIFTSFIDQTDKIAAYGEDISINTTYYVERIKKGERILEPLNKEERLNLGDVIVSRINFTLTSDVDFIVIKDSRAGMLEPVDIHSGYRWGVLFFGPQHIPSYVAVRDASTHYFYNSLKKGTYVLENRSYVSSKGSYQSGLVTIQSMYVPELSGHSGSTLLHAK